MLAPPLGPVAPAVRVAAQVIAFEEGAVADLASRAVFAGKARLYQPGKAEFERLVQHWVDRCGHHVCDLRTRTEADAGRLAKAWCDTVQESTLLGFHVQEWEAKCQGRVRVKVEASNGVDSFEKLISEKLHPEGHLAVQATAAPSDLLLEEALPGEVVPSFSAPLAKAVEADRDVGEFCGCYEARRSEELAAAGDDPRLRHRVNEDFTPFVTAGVVGFRGVRYDEVDLLVRFSVRGEGSYEAAVRAVPASRQILREPGRQACGHTGLRVPVDCLGQCQVTGGRVLRHLLVVSDVSGRRGLRDRSVTCQVTGKRALDDEVATSAVSGTVGLASLFVVCQQTNCLLLPKETGQSAFSGKVVRKDLLFTSGKPPHRLGLSDEFGVCQVTRERLLRDELETSAVSGTVADRGLLLPSARSGLLALESELVTCEVSGTVLLPSETGVCSVTGRTADASLLVTCRVTGGLVLGSKTGRSALRIAGLVTSRFHAFEGTAR